MKQILMVAKILAFTAKLHGEWHGFWRYRVGDYRIIAKIEDDKIIIFVVKIDKRGEIYS